MACFTKVSRMSQKVAKNLTNYSQSVNIVTMTKYKIPTNNRLQDKASVKILKAVNNNKFNSHCDLLPLSFSTLTRHNILNNFMLQEKTSALTAQVINSKNVLVSQKAHNSLMTARKDKTTISSDISKKNSHSFTNIKIMKTSCQVTSDSPVIIFTESDMKNMSEPQKALIRSVQNTQKKDEMEVKIDFPILLHLATFNAVPFIGFGFLDNFIMIVAGDYIDQIFGHVFCISTMAAAALGNTLSDVAGIGLAAYVERLVECLGFESPKMSESQHKLTRCRVASNFGRTVGIIIGCLIGMLPLLFLNKAAKTEICETDVSADPIPDPTIRDPNKQKHRSIIPVVLTEESKPNVIDNSKPVLSTEEVKVNATTINAPKPTEKQ